MLKQVSLKTQMLKKLLLLPLLSLSLPPTNVEAADFPMTMSGEQTTERKSAFIMNVLAPKECGEIKLNRYEEGFSLSINDKEQVIPNYMVSKPLRNMKPEQLAGFLQSNYLTLKQCSNGEFSLEEHGRLNGGGVWGARIGSVIGGVVGVSLVYAVPVVVLSPMNLIPGVGPKVYATTVAAAWKFSQPVATKAGYVGGVAGGIIGGVATGPV